MFDISKYKLIALYKSIALCVPILYERYYTSSINLILSETMQISL